MPPFKKLSWFPMVIVTSKGKVVLALEFKASVRLNGMETRMSASVAHVAIGADVVEYMGCPSAAQKWAISQH